MTNWLSEVGFAIGTAAVLYILLSALFHYISRRKRKPPQDHYFAERKKNEDS